MKKLFIILFLLLTFTFTGCYSQGLKQPDTSIIAPAPDFDLNAPEDDEDEKKKYYAVSSTNSLRIRSGAGSSYAVVGYLDKNDAVLLLGEQNGFYKTIYKEKVAYVSKNYCSIMAIESSGEKQEKAIEFGCSLLGSILDNFSFTSPGSFTITFSTFCLGVTSISSGISVLSPLPNPLPNPFFLTAIIILLLY